LLSTGIPIDSLRKIWELSDFEKNGNLDREEFALALYLSELVKKGKKVPDVLPKNLIPPSKRKGK
jgi:epidermal growth factor receptor substrate 15